MPHIFVASLRERIHRGELVAQVLRCATGVVPRWHACTVGVKPAFKVDANLAEHDAVCKPPFPLPPPQIQHTSLG